MLRAVVRIVRIVVLVGMMNSQADKPVYRGAECDERQKAPIPLLVERVARNKQ